MNPWNDNASRHSAHGRRSGDRTATSIEQLTSCRNCKCDMVYPIDWDEASSTLWRVSLRCPNCERLSSHLIDAEMIERYDILLDQGTESIMQDLRNLTVANMATEVDAFTAAIASDEILPEDF
jgi:hypothetical protein